ncbi:myosin-crossreactive antigen [Talaromyces proteolyticus]|uniref:Myosin-crossreactive antigen n=1 Tax=Talaromyces proteolyticus TaxID=1131652 RepID=A0AAD4L0Z3_9EURO|nr:myosin-crossreactive antigen [Talaromyces proteolyticus]KAH8701865.1 myosin-crossreactive antigen [Talaromyces proteolyticus]
MQGAGLKKDPRTTKCFIVGGGIGCLSAIVRLVELGVPGPNIHFIELYGDQNHTANAFGNPVDGYTVHAGLQPYYHDPCVEDLLKLVPDVSKQGRSLNDIIKDDARRAHGLPKASTRLLAGASPKPTRVDTKRLHLRLQDRLTIFRFMLEDESTLGDKAVREVFDSEFFSSNFWIFWSTTFAMQPWHSAEEFRRHLCKYLHGIQSLNDSNIFRRTQYTLHTSIIKPIEEFVLSKGVNVWQQAEPKLISTSSSNGTTSVIGIEFLSKNDGNVSLPICPEDIFIANPGPIRSNVSLGSNSQHPKPLGLMMEDAQNSDWSFWFELSKKSPEFGNPSNFCSRIGESKLVTFTVTLSDSPFFDLYTELTHNKPGSGSFVTLVDSNWCITINVPQQPIFSNQPSNVQIFWGYGLDSQNDGNIVQKPMYNCTGEEIMKELLWHLQLPGDDILKTSITIPCLSPYATSAMLTRKQGDRPGVIPSGTTNVALVGQFVEIPGETTFSMEYSVLSAEIAVSRLMGEKEPRRSRKNSLLEAFDVLS